MMRFLIFPEIKNQYYYKISLITITLMGFFFFFFVLIHKVRSRVVSFTAVWSSFLAWWWVEEEENKESDSLVLSSHLSSSPFILFFSSFSRPSSLVFNDKFRSRFTSESSGNFLFTAPDAAVVVVPSSFWAAVAGNLVLWNNLGGGCSCGNLTLSEHCLDIIGRSEWPPFM